MDMSKTSLLPHSLRFQLDLACAHRSSSVELPGLAHLLLRRPFPERSDSLAETEDDDDSSGDSKAHTNYACAAPASDIRAIDLISRIGVEEIVDVESLCGVGDVGDA